MGGMGRRGGRAWRPGHGWSARTRTLTQVSMSARHLMKRMCFQTGHRRGGGADERDSSPFATWRRGQRGWDSAVAFLAGKEGEGSSVLEGRWLRAETIRKAGLGGTPCHDPAHGGLMGNSSPPSLGVHRAHIRAGRGSPKKIEVAMFGALMQSIWSKILLAMARGLMIFNLK